MALDQLRRRLMVSDEDVANGYACMRAAWQLHNVAFQLLDRVVRDECPEDAEDLLAFMFSAANDAGQKEDLKQLQDTLIQFALPMLRDEIARRGSADAVASLQDARISSEQVLAFCHQATNSPALVQRYLRPGFINLVVGNNKAVKFVIDSIASADTVAVSMPSGSVPAKHCVRLIHGVSREGRVPLLRIDEWEGVAQGVRQWQTFVQAVSRQLGHEPILWVISDAFRLVNPETPMKFNEVSRRIRLLSKVLCRWAQSSQAYVVAGLPAQGEYSRLDSALRQSHKHLVDSQPFSVWEV